MGKFWVISFLILVSINSNAYEKSCRSFFSEKPSQITWFKQESENSIHRILKHISPADGDKGAIIAAPTRVNPNYYYHWVRDAGLTIEAIVEHYKLTTDAALKATIKQKIEEYLSFSIKVQNAPTLSGLGEPKINVDGTPFNDLWGRPQNDSPALRALSFIHWAEVLIKEGQTQYVREKLYNGSDSVIKKDLEYVAKKWMEPSYDIWEEVNATHFYTRMVQRRALIDGAKLARQLDDGNAADYYVNQAKEIEKDMPSFYDGNRGYYQATKNRMGGLDYKKSGIDVAVILGLLHGRTEDGYIKFSDERVLSTLQHIESSFKGLYPINNFGTNLGTAIGRYPEDRYGGNNFDAGNPWPLATFAVAEAYYRAAQELAVAGNKRGAQDLIDKGDTFVSRVNFHANPDGSLSEQIDRNTGYMVSVSDLTWNYAALLTSSKARNQALYNTRHK